MKTACEFWDCTRWYVVQVMEYGNIRTSEQNKVPSNRYIWRMYQLGQLENQAIIKVVLSSSPFERHVGEIKDYESFRMFYYLRVITCYNRNGEQLE